MRKFLEVGHLEDRENELESQANFLRIKIGFNVY